MRSSWHERLAALPPFCRQQLACFLAAFRFLTILPVKWRAGQDGDYFARSLHYFPVLGLLIGLAAGALSDMLRSFLPATVVAVVAVILLALVSGCLHLDGLADTADGFFSSRPKERILEIMRDSRIGAMGVIALVFVLLLKFAALSTLQAPAFFQAVCLMPFAGRCAIVVSMAILPYARPEGGLGQLFYSGQRRNALAGALILCAALVPFIGFGTLLLLGGVTLGTAGLFSIWCRRKIDGATGDTLGAVCEINEMAVAVALAGAVGF